VIAAIISKSVYIYIILTEMTEENDVLVDKPASESSHRYEDPPRLPKSWMIQTGLFNCNSEERLTDTLTLSNKTYYTNGTRPSTFYATLIRV
jgi:hypothetical protein